MKNLFLSLIAGIALLSIYSYSFGKISDEPMTMNDCSCETCEMSSCDGNCSVSCSGDMSGCNMNMSEFKKEPMKMSSGESNVTDDKCPVSGDAIGDSKVTYSYLGKEYKFCCEGCVDEFRTEPMSYIKEELKCPVQGDAASQKVTTVYEGTKYYFCCKGCDEEFMSNPEKYMNGNFSEK